MRYEVHTGRDSGVLIDLESGGKVSYIDWAFEGLVGSSPDDKPATGMCGDHTPYRSFIIALDRVAKDYPEVYRAVYEHIQGQTEYHYVQLAAYCKYKNNQYISKFRVIE